MGLRIIFLRAVNVAGATLPMARLRDIAADLGATGARTFIASGNLICTPPGDPAAFDTALERAIEQHFGFFREAISRTPQQVEQALAEYPFEIANPGFSYISFCRSAPTAEDIEAASRLATGADRWQVIGDNLHLRYAEGAGHAQMPMPSILRALKTPTTARNLRTIARLLDMVR